MEKIRIIDLSEDISPKLKILNSKEEGKLLEQKFNINFTLIRVKGKIEVIFPETLYAVGSLSFNSMFELAYRKIGEASFLEKVNFLGSEACLYSITGCLSLLNSSILAERDVSVTAYVDVD